MKGLTLAILLCLSAIPAVAAPTYSPCAASACRSAPAPLIGLGLPAAFAIGGVLAGAGLLRRKRRS
jgi:hypothetical protein